MDEKYYSELLEVFAQDLSRRGVALLMIAPERQLYGFPFLKDKVFELESEGLIGYYETSDWLENVSDYGSPEGHQWGRKAHYILGEELSKIVMVSFGKREHNG